jgi:F0F1-type ATP synthase delta subunit
MSDTSTKQRSDSALEDPGALAVATMYARSYMTSAAQNGVTAPEEELNSLIEDVLGKNPEFNNLLMSDSVGRDDKLGIVDRVIAPKSSEFFANFLRVLIRHGRITMLPMIQVYWADCRKRLPESSEFACALPSRCRAVHEHRFVSS